MKFFNSSTLVVVAVMVLQLGAIAASAETVVIQPGGSVTIGQSTVVCEKSGPGNTFACECRPYSDASYETAAVLYALSSDGRWQDLQRFNSQNTLEKNKNTCNVLAKSDRRCWR